jgi:hypothetical protein
MCKQNALLLLFCLALSAVLVQAQDDKENDKPPTGVTTGFMIKGAYGPNPWRNTAFSNLPLSFRTVDYGSVPYGGGGTYIFTQDQLKLHLGIIMLPLELGPTLNFGNRIEIAAGGAVTIDNNNSNRMQIGCYCVGSTVTYIEFLSTPVRVGGFGEVAVRLKGPAWFTAEASSSPFWSNITVRQAFSAYNSDDTLLKTHFASYRVPVTVLAGLKFCGDCNRGGRSMFGFSAGFGYWQNRVDSEFVGVQYPQNQRHLIIQGFLEYNAIFARKAKGGKH